MLTLLKQSRQNLELVYRVAPVGEKPQIWLNYSMQKWTSCGLLFPAEFHTDRCTVSIIRGENPRIFPYF